MGVPTELSLFTGYAGLTLGLTLAGIQTRTVCYVENDFYLQELIRQRIQEGYLDDAPIWDDIRTFDGKPWCGAVDIITAGFPCQPHSTAGKRVGKADSRNLWPDTLRVIGEVGPSFALLENVRGLYVGKTPFAAEVVGTLSDIGYDAVWHAVPAAAVGAPHLRWRWWCLAYSRSIRRRGRGRPTEQTGQHKEVGRVQLARSNGKSREVAGQNTGWWSTKPNVGRVDDGVAFRVDRLRACGNGVVPAVAAEFLRGLMRCE